MIGFLAAMLKPLILLISYVSNGSSFPKPLPPEEEAKYLELIMQGDENARNVLIEHNLRLVAHIAKKYAGSTRDSEDLISVGTIGLIKGINSFKPDKGVKLATYIARCVDNEILMLLRAQKKSQGDISLNESIGTDKEGNQILLIDIMKSKDEEIFEDIDLQMQIKKLYKNIVSELDDREREVVRLRYGLASDESKTQREIAKAMGISRSYVSRIEKKAVSKLRKGLVLEADNNN